MNLDHTRDVALLEPSASASKSLPAQSPHGGLPEKVWGSRSYRGVAPLRVLMIAGTAAFLLPPAMLWGADTNVGDAGGNESSCGDGGGACAPESGDTGLAMDHGNGEVCRDEDECPCDKGGSEGGTGPDLVSGPTHIRTVAWDSGEKWETVNDLVVSLPGADFRLTRQFTSNPLRTDDPYGQRPSSSYPLPGCGFDLPAGANVGKGWSWSNLRAMSAGLHWEQHPQVPPNESYAEHTGATYALLRPNRKPRIDYYSKSQLLSSSVSGPGNQRFGGIGPIPNRPSFSCDLLPSTVSYFEPGRWRQLFECGDDGFGWIIEDRDEYGNTRIYQNLDSDAWQLPDRILLNGTQITSGSGQAQAWVDLDWDGIRLVRAEVYRPTSGGSKMTQYVEYYHIEIDGGTKKLAYHNGGMYGYVDAPGTMTDLVVSDDVGKEGDLVMVAQYTATNPEAMTVVWRTQVTQYRYHDESVSAPESGDIRLRVEGLDHQLKSVFDPQQIEAAAQEMYTTGSVTAAMHRDRAVELLQLDDEDPIVSAGTKIYELAAKIVSYDPSTDRVARQFLQSGDCGCGGGAINALLKTYEWRDWDVVLGSSFVTYDGVSYVERDYPLADFDSDPTDDSDNTYRTFCQDVLYLQDGSREFPYVWRSAIVEGDIDLDEEEELGRAWVTARGYDLDEMTLEQVRTPSSVTSYTPADGLGNPPAITTSSTAGLIREYDYDGENVGVLNIGVQGSTVPVEQTTYNSDVDGSSNPILARRHLPMLIQQNRVSSPSTDDDKQITTFTYGFDASSATSAKLDWRQVSMERELESENGPDATPGTVSTWEFYDDRGQRIVTIDEHKIATRYEYDERTGTLIRVTRNYDPTDVDEIPDIVLPSGGSNPLSGVSANGDGELVTEYERDLLGRVTKVTSPGGVERWTVRGLDEDPDRPGVLYYAMISMPHQIASPASYAGPATKRLLDAASGVTRSETWAVESEASYDPGTADYAAVSALIDTLELGRTVVEHDLSGQTTGRTAWWDIANDLSYTTERAFDAFGREIESDDGTGTVAERVYDVLDRVTEVKVGTTASSPITVSRYYYDGDPGSSPSQGVGNGNLTHVELLDGEVTRTSRNYYDNRDRQVGAVEPDQPLSLTRYDNLDRAIEEAVYPEPGSVPSLSLMRTTSGGALPASGTSPIGTRSWYVKTSYSQRGMVYKQETAITPASGSTEYLASYWWYDEEGNELASWTPNSPGVVNQYDSFDRLTKVSLTDRAGDTAAAVGDADRFAPTTGVTGDHVIEETEYRYVSGSGVMDLVTHRKRSHDATATGALGNGDSVTLYTGVVYDLALRRVGAIDFGTNKSTFNTTAASAPTLTSYDTLAELRSATDVLFSWTEYDERGMVKEVVAIQDGTTAADEIRTRYLYDDLGRTKAVIENVDTQGTPATVTWSTGLDRYVVANQTYAAPDLDRVTSYEYDAAGNVVRRIAHIPDSGNTENIQETLYTYGTTVGSSATPTDSLVASNRLLASVRYPDETTGSAGSGSAYTVSYAYNALGELRAVTDQNGTIRAFERDLAGRTTQDVVTTLGQYTVAGSTRAVDDSVLRLEYAYDDLGRLAEAASYDDDIGGSVVNDAHVVYTALWQIETLTQEHDGAVDGSSAVVEYTYENADPDGIEGNYSRVSGVIYPTDAGNANPTVGVVYASGVDTRLNRITKLQVDALDGGSGMKDLIAYQRLGMSMTAKATVGDTSAPFNPTLDTTRNHDGSQADSGETYPSYDRFGRVVRHMWVRDDFANVGGASHPNKPPILEFTHTYDRSSNPLTANDARHGAKLPLRDRAFTYDGLHRLTEEFRTPANAGYTAQHKSLQWDLDMLGNWNELARDSDEDGTFTDYQGADHLDSRTHNMANEIESNGVSGTNPNYDRQVESTTSPNDRYHQHRYDHAGNMTDQRNQANSVPIGSTLMQGLRMTYDPWNRLITTQHGSGNGDGTLKDVSVYSYNALGWRTTKTFDATQGAYDGVMEQKRVFIYDASWRIAEEHIDVDFDTDAGTDWISQQFWGLRYIDDAVAKRVDRDMDGVWTDAESTTWYQITDRQFSVGAVLDSDMNLWERVDYDAYGNARHRFDGDGDGTGAFGFSDVGLFGGYGISSGSYHADLDLNFDGWTDSADTTILTTRGTHTTALPNGWISDPADDEGPDNSIGYAGYVHNPEREDYTVRFRVYAPELGKWRQADSNSYFDGQNLSNYVKSNPMYYVDWRGRTANQPNERQREAARKCQAWADAESKKDQSWQESLPDCPCSIDVSDPENPSMKCNWDDTWKEPEKGGHWKPYHPNATYQVRSKVQRGSDGSGQQCTYDAGGNLITSGPSAGTPDSTTPDFYYIDIPFATVEAFIKSIPSFVFLGEPGTVLPGHSISPSVGDHQRDDVRPYEWCALAGKEYLDLYFKYRPPNQGRNADGSPCPGNTIPNDSYGGPK